MPSNYTDERWWHKRRNELVNMETEVKEEKKRITCKSLSR